MSSTNRHNASKRHVADYYVTPQWCIRDFMKAFLEDVENNFIGLNTHNSDLLILDPCAGGDEHHEMSYPAVLTDILGCNITTLDIREDSRATIKCNFLEQSLPDYGIVITNPPFNIALDIIRKAISVTQEHGYIIMLLRLNFLGSKTRKPFFDEFMPEYIYVHNRRMSFTDDRVTDSIEYAHFVWRKGYRPKFSKLRII